MPRFITARMISPALNKTTAEKQTTKIQHLNLKAHCKHVKTQSEDTLTTQIYFFVTLKQMGLCIVETKKQVDKEKQ